MKEKYSEVNYPSLRFARKKFKKDNDIFEKCSEYTKRREELGIYDEREADLYFFEDIFFQQIIEYKKYKNYYIESKELSDLFFNTIIKKEIILNIPKIIDKSYEIEREVKDMNKNIHYIKTITGIINHKSSEQSIFFMVVSSKDEGYNKGSFFITNGRMKYISPFEVDNLKDINNSDNFVRFVLNMIFYMDAFPDKISNKPPEEMCDKLNFNNSKTISIAKDIEDYLHENREVSPHLRRGHFRFLESERYTKKKGQTIFVKSSFVKGKAVTVMD